MLRGVPWSDAGDCVLTLLGRDKAKGFLGICAVGNASQLPSGWAARPSDIASLSVLVPGLKVYLCRQASFQCMLPQTGVKR